jgi:threonine dehydratase
VISGDDVRAAAALLEGIAHRTPPVYSRTLGAEIVLKPECLQRGGSFKFRGAYNMISTLGENAEVVAFSSGNHAQAVALASQLLGAHATIVMPADAPQLKVDATRGYGAEIVTYDRYTEDRVAIANALAAERDATIVPPFDDPLIMAGAGTAALELLEDAGVVDTLVTPVGGGGLISGCATIAKELGVRRVVGVEPATGNDWQQSLAAGEIVSIGVPRTIADGLQTPSPGEHTWAVGSQLVDEPSGAVGIAAVLNGLVEAPSVGVVVSGGNVGADRFAELVA